MHFSCSEIMENLEMQEYRRQLCQRPHMISITTNNESAKSSDKKKGNALYETRLAKQRLLKPVRNILISCKPFLTRPDRLDGDPIKRKLV